MKQYAILLPVLLFFSACTSGTTGEDTQMNLAEKEYVGLTVERAQQKAAAADVSFRVIMKDGEPQPATMDYRPGRINATVENGIVTAYTVEGEDAQQETYDQNSWKTLIADSCISYSDGCNTCNRNEENGLAACTKKFCQQYEKPRCLDGE